MGWNMIKMALCLLLALCLAHYFALPEVFEGRRKKAARRTSGLCDRGHRLADWWKAKRGKYESEKWENQKEKDNWKH